MKTLHELNSEMLGLLDTIERDLALQEESLTRIEAKQNFKKIIELSNKITESISNIKSRIYEGDEYEKLHSAVVGFE